MLPENLFNEKIFKIILSKPAKTAGSFQRVEILRSGGKYQASTFTDTKVTHTNHDAESVREFISGLFGAEFLCYTAWDGEFEFSARVTKRGRVLSSRRKAAATPGDFAEGFNRRKNYIISEGENIPALVDIGVFTKEFKVAAQMRDKFSQINRFLELLADETRALPAGTIVNIIDFGCGKSYLTFLVYHYFSEIQKLPANICGLDLNAEVVEKCAAAAKKYGYSPLEFRQGDIGSLAAPTFENWGERGTFNIVISLHACDTATDHALFFAVRHVADLVCAVPCCQHELRAQMRPKSLGLFAEYGIIEERIASLATDAIRAKALEACGYKAQIIEFVPMEHTAKNLLIRARKTKKIPRFEVPGEIKKIVEEFSFEPTILKLLREI